MLVNLLIWILILGLIFSIVFWTLNQIPLAAPWNIVARALLAIIALVIILQLILPLAGPLHGCAGRLIC